MVLERMPARNRSAGMRDYIGDEERINAMQIKGPNPFVVPVSPDLSPPARSIGPNNRTDTLLPTPSSPTGLKKNHDLIRGHTRTALEKLAKVRRLKHAKTMAKVMKSLDTLRSKLDANNDKIDQLQQRRDTPRGGPQVQAQARHQPAHPQPVYQRLVARAVQKAYPYANPYPTHAFQRQAYAPYPVRYAQYPTSFGMSPLQPRVAFPGFMATIFGSSLLGVGMLAALLF